MRTEVGTGENHTHFCVPSSLFLLRSYCKDLSIDETVIMSDFVKDLIVKSSGNLSKIELFAREESPGWDCWGNNTNKFNKNSIQKELIINEVPPPTSLQSVLFI